MKEEDSYNAINPEKTASRLAINSTMTSTLFFILTLVWALNPKKFSILMISELVLAIPLLYTSSFAYSKLGYWKIKHRWGEFGWITNTTGNIFVLNVIGLMTAGVYLEVAYLYFGLTIVLMGAYYFMHVVFEKRQLKIRIMKFIYFLILIICGGIIPVILIGQNSVN